MVTLPPGRGFAGLNVTALFGVGGNDVAVAGGVFVKQAQVAVAVAVPGSGVFVRVAVFVGGSGVLVRVAVFVGGNGVLVRVAVFVAGAGVAVASVPHVSLRVRLPLAGVVNTRLGLLSQVTVLPFFLMSLYSTAVLAGRLMRALHTG